MAAPVAVTHTLPSVRSNLGLAATSSATDGAAERAKAKASKNDDTPARKRPKKEPTEVHLLGHTRKREREVYQKSCVQRAG